MYKIAALIDFTPTTDVVIEFAKNLALQKGAEVCLVTVVEEAAKQDEAAQKMKPFEQMLVNADVAHSTEITIGHFIDVISPFVDKLHVDLVIVGTHGKRGLRQNLFGSFILKLVKALQVPSLVVQDSSVWPEGGFKNAFFPIASHSHFEMKIEQTNQVLAEGGKLTLYAIYKTDSLDDKLKKNIQLSRSLFEKAGIDFNVVEEDVQMYSVGYSRQSLVYATEHNMQLISIMSQVSKDNKFFGNADKENVILNPAGIPVLCCNDEEEHF